MNAWNGEIFYSLQEAQIVMEQWREEYNTRRPHSALDYRPPAPALPLEEMSVDCFPLVGELYGRPDR